MERAIQNFLKYASSMKDVDEKYKFVDEEIKKDYFMVVSQCVYDIIKEITKQGIRLDIDNIPKETLEKLFLPMFIPLIDTINNQRKVLEKQAKYALPPIIISKEQMEEFKKFNINGK